MEDPRERLTKCASTNELERRWKAIRDMMRERELDYLLIQNSEEFLGGTLRWFSDFTARHQFPMTIIFPVDDEMTLINCGGDIREMQPFPPPWAARGIKNRFGAVYFPTINYTNTLDAEIAVDVLKEKKKAKIGLVERAFIPITFYEYLVKHLPDATFVDATEWVHEIMAIKSPEEIEMIKATAALQDGVMEHLKKTIKPGMKDLDVYSEAHWFASKNGSERGLVQVNSGPLGTMVPFDVYHYQNRVIKEGDQVSVLIEVNGPGGYYCEIMRIFIVGKEPSQDLKDAFAVCVEAQEMTFKRLKPGENPKELWDMNKEFLVKNGYFPPVRLYAHGQGLSLVERPLLRANEPWKLKAGMNITVHPSAARKDVWAIVCDNFIIKEDGAEKLHKFPREIIVV
ncbi:MAG: Xaa-Pro peptidase family protein [Deltaproteobacteria bacterium]|nr:Xaa-Pro peptidase family protein [Deltaproteobacteria bacterium]